MRDRGLFNLTHLGWGIALPVAFLCMIGLAAIHSTEVPDDGHGGAGAWRGGAASAAQRADRSAPEGMRRIVEWVGADTLKQAMYILTGIGLMFGTMAVGYPRVGRVAYVVYWAVIAMLSLLVIDRFIDMPFIPVKRLTRRWIEFGAIRLQPSEFMKPAIILALARYLRYRKNYREWRGLIAPLAATLLPMGLIHFQPDLGTLLMLLPVLFAMLFVAGARLRHLLTVVLLGLVTLPVFYAVGMQEYQRNRIDVLLRQNDPDEDWQRNQGFQLRQSKIALGTGGLWGQGWRQGMFTEYDLLPERQNDFIFALIGHQWGLLGCALVILAYAVIVLYAVEVSTATNDPFGRLVAVGVMVMIAVQAILNAYMTIGLAPITGMTLPFVSAGGSSLWANFVGLGLLLSVAQRRPMLIAHPPFEHDRE